MTFLTRCLLASATAASVMTVHASALAAQGAAARGTPRGTPSLRGVWRITTGRVAPWRVDAPPDTMAWRGQRVRFDGARVEGPAPLRCGGATYRERDVEWDGLFQGNLPDPQAPVARSLGFSRLPVPSIEVNCDAGSFDFHRLGADTLLTAVDNVVWTLVRLRGANR